MRLPPQADIGHAAALAATLPGAVAEGSGAFEVDASALDDVDSSTIALLLQARRLAAAAGRGFVVRGAPAKLGQLARLYGVEELLSLEAAPAASA